jgi:hypothetical protein
MLVGMAKSLEPIMADLEQFDLIDDAIEKIHLDRAFELRKTLE